MAQMKIEKCPETGICSLVKQDGSKVDLMPDEVEELRGKLGNAADVKDFIANVDPSFAAALNDGELKQMADELPE